MNVVSIGRHKGIFVTPAGEVKMDQWGENGGETPDFSSEKPDPFRSSISNHVHPLILRAYPEPYTLVLSSG